MVELEREKTYLLKRLPKDLQNCKSEVIRDFFVPASAEHPILRLRQRGDHYEITKKQPLNEGDASKQEEHTIQLTKSEFEALTTGETKQFSKRRYYCNIESAKAEVDIYLDALQGLAVVDFEFGSDKDFQAFTDPSICLADVTQEEGLAGGILAGKSYKDLKPVLDKYNYKPLAFEVGYEV